MAGYDNNKLGELRPNQIITTFGPGAIVDAVKDSVTVLDINYWKEKGKKIIDGRLASYLGVDCFYMPRTSYSGDVPVISFPTIHVCSNLKCGRLFDARDNFDLERYLRFGVTCPECHKPAYPSRFITICENGHMDDFPWSWWVHRGMTNCKGKLKMYSTGNTSTLADMWIECELCGAKRSMSGATQEDNFSELRCSGHHPFRPRSRNERCDKKVIPSQRGASNVYFSVSRSAISIPPWVNPLYNLIDEHLHDIELLEDVMGDDGVTAAYNKYFADNYTRTEFDEALTRRLSNITEFKEIKQMEYDAITHHRAKSTKNTVEGMIRGAKRYVLITGYSLSGYFADLVDVLIEKSQKGIYVKFFVNNIENQKGFDKLCRYKGRFLHIYNFAGSKDSMAALHAKVISVDEQQTLITSANLSYHGQEGNIELGTLVDSKKIARQVDDVFTHLIFNKIVQEI